MTKTLYRERLAWTRHSLGNWSPATLHSSLSCNPSATPFKSTPCLPHPPCAFSQISAPPNQSQLLGMAEWVWGGEREGSWLIIFDLLFSQTLTIKWSNGWKLLIGDSSATKLNCWGPRYQEVTVENPNITLPTVWSLLLQFCVNSNSENIKMNSMWEEDKLNEMKNFLLRMS